jgi:hypothetical protein
MWRGRIRFTTGHPNSNAAVKCTKTGKKMGRPISFDKGAMLGAAMLLFSNRGYKGTSVADLTYLI